jgi:hypothetical protein
MTVSFLTRLGSYIWRDYATDGVPASGKHKPKKDEVRTWASEMETQLSSAPARVGLQYQFSTETNTAAHPGAGYIRFNLSSPSPEGVTEIAIADLDKFGIDYSGLIALLDDSSNSSWRATLIIRQEDGDFAAAFRVNAASIDAAGWTRLQVEWVSGTGEFTNNANIGIIPLPTGNEGGTKIGIAIFDPYTPIAGEIMWAAPVPAAATFLAGLTESRGTCSGLPTAEAVFSLRRAAVGTDPASATEFATVTYAAGVRTPTFACAADTEFNAGDTLVVVSPDPVDPTLTKPSFTLVAHIT